MSGVTTEANFAALLDLIGRRWTLRILWELRDGSRSFNALRKQSGGMSQSVLVTRLTELYGAGLIADIDGGYQLTPRGAAVAERLEPLRAWALADTGPE